MLIDYDKLEMYPPFLVVAIARQHGRTMLTIAADSGLPLRTVSRISALWSWRDVNMDKVEKFCRGCNFDLKSTRKADEFMRRTAKSKHKFSRLTPIQRRTLERKIVEWQKLQSGR